MFSGVDKSDKDGIYWLIGFGRETILPDEETEEIFVENQSCEGVTTPEIIALLAIHQLERESSARD